MEFLNFTWLENITLENKQIVLQVFLIILFTGVINYIAGRFIRSIVQRTGKTANLWDDALIHAVRRPVRLLIWTVGITFAMEITGSESEMLSSIANPARDVGVIFSIAWFALRFIKSVEKNVNTDAGNNLKIDRTTISAIAKLLRVAVFITAILIGMQTLGFSVSGVLAFGGIGGMAIGFAAKDMLSNFFGAMMIYFDRPFSVGDWIRSPDKEIEGTVEEIGWRQTRIRTFDKRPLYVPNAVFSTIAVENPSRMTHRRINETIGVRYDDMEKVNSITSGIEQMLRNHDEIDTSQTLMVHLNFFGASSVDFFIYTFTKTTDWIKFHGVKQDVMLKIAEIIKENGAEIAFPTTTIDVPKEVMNLRLTPSPTMGEKVGMRG